MAADDRENVERLPQEEGGSTNCHGTGGGAQSVGSGRPSGRTNGPAKTIGAAAAGLVASVSPLRTLCAPPLNRGLKNALVRFLHQPAERVKQKAYELHISQLDILSKQFQSDYGRWPSTNMRELKEGRYIGSPIPVCPVDRKPFVFDRRVGQVATHRH